MSKAKSEAKSVALTDDQRTSLAKVGRQLVTQRCEEIDQEQTAKWKEITEKLVKKYDLRKKVKDLGELVGTFMARAAENWNTDSKLYILREKELASFKKRFTALTKIRGEFEEKIFLAETTKEATALFEELKEKLAKA